jgi:hypothetical protein
MGASNTFGKLVSPVTKIGALAVGGPLGLLGLKKAKGALMPDAVAAPDVPDPVEMPDPLQQQQAKRRSLIEQLSRSGRSSTVLTNQGGTKLGG